MRAAVVDPRVGPLLNRFTDPGATHQSVFDGWAGNSPNTNTRTTAAASWAASGSACTVTWTNRGNDSGDIGFNIPAGTANTLFPAGRTFTIVWNLVCSLDGFNVVPNLVNVSGGTVTSTLGPGAHPAAGVPVRQWATLNRSADTVSIGSLRSTITGPLTPVTFAISDVAIYEGRYRPGLDPARLSPYQGRGWVWLGTPGASQSVGYPGAVT